MRRLPVKGVVALASASLVLGLAACNSDEASPDPSQEPASYTMREVTDGSVTFVVVENPYDGPRLTYSVDGPVTLLEEIIDGSTYAFKDMNANGTLDPWEDWRLEASARAADLADELTKEQIAGLMLFSSHERSPGDGLTDAQKEYLTDSHLRNVLNAAGSDGSTTVAWVNEMQAYVEDLAASGGLAYVPVNFSSDPRSTAGSGGYNADGADISRWPSSLGLAATFDADHTAKFGEMASAEYRALGITTALSPQIDLATEPRWLRVGGTFGEDVDMNVELTAAYVNGFQGTGGEDAWGPDSVNAMVKHWAGDGPGEGGRESHTNAGKYGVYPGGNFAEHTEAFLGSLNSAAVMTSYSIAVDGNGEPLFDRVGTAYDAARMGLLREDNGFEGVIVTDWGVMSGSNDEGAFFGMAWGAEDLTPGERYFEVLLTGHDMFGGVNNSTRILEGYDIWQERFEAGDVDVDAETRFKQSGARILTMLFNPGLYESAYLDPQESAAILASDDKVAAGYAAQLDSVVMLKNDGDTVTASQAADWADKTAYIPRSYNVGVASAFGPAAYTEAPGLTIDVAERYFANVVTDEAVMDADGVVTSYTAPDLSTVDIVLVGMASPDSGGNFSNVGHDRETDEWYPISLQYRPYTADGDNVRRTSISGDILADGTQENRSYFGNTSRIANEADLDAFERAVAAVEASGKDIPVITVLKAINPVVPAEFEAKSDAIIVGFGTSDQALIEVALGLYEPKGRLPIQFPLNMDTVEAQLEDVARDMTPYTDANGNVYDYGFGLNYSGPIR
ncbi:MAG: glycoside hydrolase family 3 [Actinobacteria bacterium HGW-Actinobacteria-4]|nr:MAG: glycoside hydrolase family 3 [Actinobacteria bacterium HGW-Actinobacteria-4]